MAMLVALEKTTCYPEGVSGFGPSTGKEKHVAKVRGDSSVYEISEIVARTGLFLLVFVFRNWTGRILR